MNNYKFQHDFWVLISVGFTRTNSCLDSAKKWFFAVFQRFARPTIRPSSSHISSDTHPLRYYKMAPIRVNHRLVFRRHETVKFAFQEPINSTQGLRDGWLRLPVYAYARPTVHIERRDCNIRLIHSQHTAIGHRCMLDSKAILIPGEKKNKLGKKAHFLK